MKSQSNAPRRRGLFARVRRSPRFHGAIGGSFLMAGLTIMVGLTVSGASPVQAGGICQPNSAYSLPTAINLSTVPTGLTLVDDAPLTYGIGGDTDQAIRGALTTCAPKFQGSSPSGDYLAYTSYIINWGYGIERVGPSTCRLTDIKVGLRVNQLLPTLTTDASRPVLAKWTSFNAALRAHEDGHKALDIAQARRLLAALRNTKAPCATIKADTADMIESSLQELTVLNANHDSETHSGIDQGAIW